MPNLLGMAVISRAAYERRDLSALLDGLRHRAAASPPDPAAMMDLATLLEICGQRRKSAALQLEALSRRRVYETLNGSGDGLRVLHIKTAGNLMANTPVEFLLETGDTRLLSIYVDADMDHLPPLPSHDVAILGVGESEANRPLLALLQRWRAQWPRPVFNNEPQRILMLARERLAAAFSDTLRVVVPRTMEVDSRSLRAIANLQTTLCKLFAGFDFPVIVRPFGAHAGHCTRKIDCAAQLAENLGEVAGERFTVTPYFDYADSDGLFRKQRIAFISGRPYPCHMAVSRHWMVHYLNADMEINADRRAQEAAWMTTFDSDFAVRHERAFEELARCIGLDYFAIDCAELPDGRLIVFEADTAMIVHGMDSPELFPYKMPAMRKLFAAFEDALLHFAESGSTRTPIPVEGGHGNGDCGQQVTAA